MEQVNRQFRAFETSVEAQKLLPNSNAEFNEFIRSQTIVPTVPICERTVDLDPIKSVTALVHNYSGTPGEYVAISDSLLSKNSITN